MGQLLNISICADDIVKTKAEKSKNGKTYYNFTVSVNDTVNDYGKDVSIWHNQTKEERDANEQKSYVGSGKTVWSSNGATAEQKPKYGAAQAAPQQQQQPVDDDLPF